MKYLSYIYQTSTRICMRSVGWVLWTGHWKIGKNTIRSGTNCNRSDKFASKDSLYFETGWETLANRWETRKLTTFYKIHNKLSPPYLFNCLPPSDVNSYNLRHNQNYVPPRCRLRTSASSCIPSTVSLWNNIDISIRNSPTLSSFQNRVLADIYKTPKYYNEGPWKLSILHTRLRHQCSSLNHCRVPDKEWSFQNGGLYIIKKGRCEDFDYYRSLSVISVSMSYTFR